MRAGWGGRVADVVFVAALVALAAVAAWPIYRTPYLVVTAAGALAVGVGVALLGTLRRMPWPVTLLLGVVAALLFGVPLADPGALPGRGELLAGYPDVLAAAVFGWKQLVTIELPVGEYQQLLVPFYLVVMASAATALSVAWRTRVHPLVAPIMLAPVAFAIAFGSSAVSDPVRLGPLLVPAPRETAIGLAALVLAGAFLRFRMLRARAAAVRTAAAATGIHRVRNRGLFGRVRRVALGLLVALVAIGVALPATASALRSDDRRVLRTAIDPAVELQRYPSPLADYRASFTADAYGRALFSVSGDTAGVDRLRLATLGFYDGTRFGVVDPSDPGDPSTAFARVPQLSQPGVPAGSRRITVAVDGYTGVWAPTVSGLQRVSFAGDRASALGDGFFYSGTASAGVDLAGLARGDRYTLVASAPGSAAPALAQLQKPQGASGMVASRLIPKSLVDWVQAQRLGDDGAALGQLIARLRDRGYLSHFVLPDGSDARAWTRATGAEVVPSLAGESLGRIGELFDSLNQKQSAEPANATDAQLVAAVGDDEQFSVAAALVAQYLGFPSRVVLGFRLSDAGAAAGSAPDPIPACADGVCSGRNLTAWVEVQGADGRWAAVDTTPQLQNHVNSLEVDRQEQRNVTQPRPQDATEQQPPEANPSGGQQRSSTDHQTTPVARRWVPVVKTGGGVLLVLLVLAAPLLATLAVKGARRRQRRQARSAAERIAGGWDELVDAAVDMGLPHPVNLTRSETVEGWLRPGSRTVRQPLPTPLAVLATDADAAVFGDVEPSDAAAAQYWALIELERDRLAQRLTPWRRLRARFSLRSFRTRAAGRRRPAR